MEQMKNWFAGASTVGAIRSLYHKLAMQWHPDRGGDNETMKQINLAYEKALEQRDGEVSKGFDGQPHEYHYNAAWEREVMQKVLELLSLRLDGIEVEMIGTWVWVSGDTKPVKDALKAHGLRWHSKRLMWYWHRPTYRHTYSDVDTDTLRWMYGSKRFEAEAENAVAVA